MSRKGKTSQPAPTVSPVELTMDLFAPGMTPLHRAGLGGLACTLKYIERAYDRGELSDDEVPGGPWDGGHPPWLMGAHTIILKWGNTPKDYLEKLFALAYQTGDDEVILMRGQYGDNTPSLEIRAALQDGLLRSFYDHGPQSRGIGEGRSGQITVDDKPLSYQYVPVKWYKHQRDGAKLAFASLDGAQDISRMIYPGATERHNGVAGTSWAEPALTLIPLLFAPVGCIALRAGGKEVRIQGKKMFKPGAVILIPDIQDIACGLVLIPALVPGNVQATRVLGSSDAVLDAEVRLRASAYHELSGLAGIRTLWCCATTWNARLQPPSATHYLDQRTANVRMLDQYATARTEMPPRIAQTTKRENAGRGKNKITTEHVEYFWAESNVRPLVADNLAAGKPWYLGFHKLMGGSVKQKDSHCRKTAFERKGLHAMVQKMTWDDDAERSIVEAVHEAVRGRYGKIAEENKGKPVAMKNRWAGEYDHWRLTFVGAKTADQFRSAFANLVSRSKNKTLMEAWRSILPLLRPDKWQLARDLSLLALASYGGKGNGNGNGNGNDDNPLLQQEGNTL